MYAALAATPARDWIDYLTAFGTVGAVVVALAFGLLEYGRGRRKATREQAEQVSAWCQNSLFEQGDFKLVGKGVVRNPSSAPIHQVVVSPRQVGVEAWLVLPEDSIEFHHEPPEFAQSAGIRVTFTDNAGRRWTRSPSGRLTRVRRWWSARLLAATCERWWVWRDHRAARSRDRAIH